jgi:hypothetical protein
MHFADVPPGNHVLQAKIMDSSMRWMANSSSEDVSVNVVAHDQLVSVSLENGELIFCPNTADTLPCVSQFCVAKGLNTSGCSTLQASANASIDALGATNESQAYQRQQATQDAPASANNFGIQFANEGALGMNILDARVTGVEGQGQADRLGVRVGDTIVQVNSEAAAQSMDALVAQLQAMPRPGLIVFRRGNDGLSEQHARGGARELLSGRERDRLETLRAESAAVAAADGDDAAVGAAATMSAAAAVAAAGGDGAAVAAAGLASMSGGGTSAAVSSESERASTLSNAKREGPATSAPMDRSSMAGGSKHVFDILNRRASDVPSMGERKGTIEGTIDALREAVRAARSAHDGLPAAPASPPEEL